MNQKRISGKDKEILLRRVIAKRNPNPRIDQMILIFAAKTIRQSKVEIPGVQNLLWTMLRQRDRVNEWVIPFVAAAIAAYPFYLDQGDDLVDELERQLAWIHSGQTPRPEYFGYHFLPPPGSAIQSYIDGIDERSVRELERQRYYTLITNNVDEQSIQDALTYLQAHGATPDGKACVQLMACVMRYRRQLPFDP